MLSIAVGPWAGTKKALNKMTHRRSSEDHNRDFSSQVLVIYTSDPHYYGFQTRINRCGRTRRYRQLH
jgi:hypothetical protein